MPSILKKNSFVSTDDKVTSRLAQPFKIHNNSHRISSSSVSNRGDPDASCVPSPEEFASASERSIR